MVTIVTCNKRLNKLLDKYKQLLNEYDTLYKDNMDEYMELSNNNDLVNNVSQLSKYTLLQQSFDNIKQSRKMIKKAMKECQDLTNSNTVQLLHESIELNSQVEKIEKQNKKIKQLKKQKYSSMGQKFSLDDTNLFLKKNVLLLIIICVALIIILNYLIFNK